MCKRLDKEMINSLLLTTKHCDLQLKVMAGGIFASLFSCSFGKRKTWKKMPSLLPPPARRALVCSSYDLVFYFDSVSLYFLSLTLCFLFSLPFSPPESPPDFYACVSLSVLPLIVVSCASKQTVLVLLERRSPVAFAMVDSALLCFFFFSRICLHSWLRSFIVVWLVSSCSVHGCPVLALFSVSVLVVWNISGSGVSFVRTPLVEFEHVWNT